MIYYTAQTKVPDNHSMYLAGHNKSCSEYPSHKGMAYLNIVTIVCLYFSITPGASR